MVKTTGGKSSSKPKITVMQGQGAHRLVFVKARKNIRIIVVISVVVLLIAGLVFWKQSSKSDNDSVIEQISRQEYAERSIKQIKSALPKESDPVDSKISYRFSLVEAEVQANRYDDALKDYKELLKLLAGTDKGTYEIYSQGAALYTQLGDKSSALKELEKAQAAVEAIKDPETRELNLAEIKQQRESIK